MIYLFKLQAVVETTFHKYIYYVHKISSLEASYKVRNIKGIKNAVKGVT